jgi:hypothetical protein
MCRLWDANGPRYVATVSKRGSGGLGDSLVHQQNGNVIPNRIDAVALSALEALPFVLGRQWLLADRANQHVK